MSEAAKRLRKQLEIPASLMGGQTSILNLADVHHILSENDRLRAALKEISVEADANMEGAGEPEFSQFDHIAAKARAALR